ncbi:MAG: hypothetical protein GXY68_10165 [Chloroflexi bacterium]|jgi:hypothetical protein|nr:hypothetical protein [Chloroflexota bacterium]
MISRPSLPRRVLRAAVEKLGVFDRADYYMATFVEPYTVVLRYDARKHVFHRADSWRIEEGMPQPESEADASLTVYVRTRRVMDSVFWYHWVKDVVQYDWPARKQGAASPWMAHPNVAWQTMEWGPCPGDPFLIACGIYQDDWRGMPLTTSRIGGVLSRSRDRYQRLAETIALADWVSLRDATGISRLWDRTYHYVGPDWKDDLEEGWRPHTAEMWRMIDTELDLQTAEVEAAIDQTVLPPLDPWWYALVPHEQHRAIVELYQEGLFAKEIAERLNYEPDTVTSLVKKLRDRLGPEVVPWRHGPKKRRKHK